MTIPSFNNTMKNDVMPIHNRLYFSYTSRSSLYQKIISAILSIIITSSAFAAEVTVSPPTSAIYQYIYVTGTIDSGDDVKLHDALELVSSAGKHSAIDLISRGGDVDVSMAMGRYIRHYNGVTYHGYCASSCVFAFLGGVQRYNEEGDDSQLVVHRPELAESYVANPTAGARAILGILEGYIVEMTGTNKLNSLMMQVPLSDLHSLSQTEALYTNAITAGAY